MIIKYPERELTQEEREFLELHDRLHREMDRHTQELLLDFEAEIGRLLGPKPTLH